ncbi:MAG: 16S rRNA (guanine(527)-N(7))-methyltransferase RsmG [Bacilli bacterium]|nr:16S rRNA (guanine(527)-N(7))-methyltransferase RsmG [Bacilli bacterium]
MNENTFYNELEKLNIYLTDIQKKQFKDYYIYLNEYNSHTNITTITELENVYLKHFYDSILLSKTIDFNAIKTMLDIGCGAGFPGLVLKIVYPHLNLTLLDSNNKKTTFCKCVVNKLNLNNVTIINKRAEDYIKEKREYFDLVTARAVKDLTILSELAIPYVKENNYFIAMKSDYKEELNKSINGINILGGKYLETKNINLPNNEGIRNFIIIKKISKTNQKYPRQYNQILKKPL